MSNRSIVALKFVVFPACLIPLAVLVYQGFTNTLGPDPVATITHTTGFWTLYFLLISLAITPVRRLSRRLAWLIRFRRMLGLFAFFYATLHLTTWVWLYSSFDAHAMVHDIAKRPFITMGMFGWTCQFLLAATSTTWSIRKLGGKRWTMLHRLAYVAATAGVIHYWWIVKTGVRTPWKVTVVLAVLLLARALWSAKEAARRKKVAIVA
ncbi:MAG: protein-methionine-sulfoxide reductase heme-binding subunit MsrQ [Acidobacteriaceae bacterium]